MLKVIAEDFMHPDAVEILMPMYEELVAATRKEPLCISYDLFVDRRDPGHFVFIETWPDQAALDIHCASENFQRLVPAINKYQRDEPRFILMNSAVE
ncbi:putative quinol monooxygenase [Morganella psychrotolerans]|uniref:putative quinol monooxygenase n=1 Tax=Morganella psychrotolerans TaxID=368603 RepID=UPI0039AFABA9